MLNRDYKEMLQCLSDEGVEFIVVGAYAMAIHGFPRSTADFDIWINPTEDNAKRLFRAVARFGAPLQGITAADFTHEGIVFQIGVAPCRIDIITQISGDILFEEASSQAVKIEFDEINVPVLSIVHLIRNKQATGRRKDLDDVRALQKRHAASVSTDRLRKNDRQRGSC